MITLERLKNAVANIKADDEWVNDSHTHARYRGVCEGLDMLIEHFEEVEEEEQKGGAEAGFVAQLLFYPVTEQLFVFNDSQVRCQSLQVAASWKTSANNSSWSRTCCTQCSCCKKK